MIGEANMATIEQLLHRRTDLSTFVVHFTRSGQDTSSLDNLRSILRSGRLEARNVYGMARDLATEFPAVERSQSVVCFTETPLEHAWMMCSQIDSRTVQFDGFGVAFTKTFARRRGANPVWYLDITPGHDWLTTAVNTLREAAKADAADPWNGVDPEKLAGAPILKLTPFIEQMGNPAGIRKEFWWEREWRHVGDVHFEASDIVVVFAPEGEHASLRESLESDPDYHARMPKLIDVDWGLERMVGVLAGVPDLGPFPQ
jgi:hypothetical protein